MLFQGLFRNPLADPAVIGVSSGAALGAIAVIVLGGASVAGGLVVTSGGVRGRVATALLVYGIARASGRPSRSRRCCSPASRSRPRSAR